MDYKKKYKELVEILNKANEDNETKYKTFSCVFDDIMSKIRANEDERIGDEIIHFVTTTHDTRLVGNKKHVDEWVSWIDEQKGKDKLIEELGAWKVKYIQEVLSEKTKDEIEKQVKNKHKFNIGDIISNGNVTYRVDNIVKNCIGQDCYFLVNVESEKKGMRYYKLRDSEGNTHNAGETTWLCEQVDAKFEKQREQKPYGQMEKCINCQFNYTGYCNGTCILKNNEQKTDNKAESIAYSYTTPNPEFFQWIYDRLVNVYNENPNVDYMLSLKERIEDMRKPSYMFKPKFHKGDFIKHNKANIICKVISVDCGSYYVENIETNGGIELFNAEQNFHLWSIEDAKDGDVLHSPEHNLLWIYKNKEECHTAVNLNYANSISFGSDIVIPSDVCPATKEQRDLLFSKMRKAGYEWSEETRESKKIEQEELSDFEKSLKHIIEEAIEDGDTHNLKADAELLLSLIQKPSDEEMKELLRTEYEKGRADVFAEMEKEAER